MRKILFAILVLFVVGIFGWFARPLTFPVLDWLKERPAAATTWYDDRLFNFRATSAIRCANKQLVYSTVLGIDHVTNKAGQTVILMGVHFLSRPGLDTREAILEDQISQLVILFSCVDQSIPMDRLVLNIVELNVVTGYSQTGKLDSVVTATLAYIISSDREIFELLRDSSQRVKLVDEMLADGRLNAIPVYFYGRPLDPEWTRGALVLEAMDRSDAFKTEQKRLATEAE